MVFGLIQLHYDFADTLNWFLSSGIKRYQVRYMHTQIKIIKFCFDEKLPNGARVLLIGLIVGSSHSHNQKVPYINVYHSMFRKSWYRFSRVLRNLNSNAFISCTNSPCCVNGVTDGEVNKLFERNACSLIEAPNATTKQNVCWRPAFAHSVYIPSYQ